MRLWVDNDRLAPPAAVTDKRMQTCGLEVAAQPQFQIGPIGVRVQQGPKVPPL